ncbi:hypothetical protein CCAX7_004870 [Capsulimonas corticalis]|uniref:Uncharacterized protein n=1 Tax=Capsulimonas corticalis TaxID=2219043 RepID=A0A402D2V6_9BACT|nr:aquaporin [Capsulimonas corticalis]BDI28436.1 hypothetical protein CCAX7_004870 [Capsulimonas corticalis]
MPRPSLTLVETSREEILYAEWKRCGHHLEEYASEFAGAAFLVFCVVAFVSLMFASGSPMPALLPSSSLRLLCAGLLIGGAGGLVAISPPGRLSGAHINPAVSLGFWLLGKMHANDLAGYAAAQMAGALLGAALGIAAFGRWAREIHRAVLSPAAGLSAGGAFTAEVAATFALASVLFCCVSHPRVARFTPAIMMLVSGVLVCLDGAVSGAGMNPARWFGPAAIADDWRLGWVYWLAPCLGSLLAVLPRRFGLYRHAMPATAKLFHDTRFRSIFRHDRVPSKLPAHLAKEIDASARP